MPKNNHFTEDKMESYSDSYDDDNDENEEPEICKRIIKSMVTYRMPQRPAPKPLQFGENVTNMMLKLNSMRQNSHTAKDYKKLEILTDRLTAKASQQGQGAIEVRFLLEKAKNAHFKKDMEKAIQISQVASGKCDFLQFNEGHQLKMISFFLMISCYSNMKDKLGIAKDILDELEQQVSFTDNPVDKWKLNYNYGTHYLAYLKLMIPLPIIRKNAREKFSAARQAITTAINNGSTFSVAEKIFPIIMMAKILLDVPETKAGWSRDDMVTEEDLEEAEELIKTIKASICVLQMDVRLKARLAITEAGLYFRKAQTFIRWVKNAKKKNKDEKLAKGNLVEAHAELSEAMRILEFATKLTENSPYQENEFAQNFLNFIHEYKARYVHTELDCQEDLDSDQTTASSDDSESKKKRMTIFKRISHSKVEIKLPNIGLVTTCEIKLPSSDEIPNMAVQDRYLKELETLQDVFDGILHNHAKHLTPDGKQLVIFPLVLRVRVATDFPETKQGMSRDITRPQVLDTAKENLIKVKQTMYLDQMCPVLKIYFLLAEAGYQFRHAQSQLGFNNIQTTKEGLCNAIILLEHVTFYKDDDRHGVIKDVENFKSVLIKTQKKLFQLENID